MAVVGVANLKWQGQTGDFNDSGDRQYTAVYEVRVDDPLDGQNIVILASGIPRLGRPYSFGNDRDNTAFLRSLAPKRIDATRLLWQVVATWTTADINNNSNGGGGEDSNGNPTDDPLQYRNEYNISKAKFSVPVERAIIHTALTGANRRDRGSSGPVVNSAGVVFVPGIEKDETRTVIRITKNLKLYPTGLDDKFQDAVNLNEYVIHLPAGARIVAPLRSKCENIGGSFQIEKNKGIIHRFWKVEFEVHIKKTSWRDDVCDRGLHASAGAGDPDGLAGGGILSPSDLIPGVPQVRRLVDANGIPIDEPILLDLKGQPLKAGLAARYITYQKYDELDFNDLGL